MKKKFLIPFFLAALALPLGISRAAEEVDAQMFGEANNKNDYVAYGLC